MIGERPKERRVATDGLGERSCEALPVLGKGRAKPRELRSDEHQSCVSGDPGEGATALRPSSRHRPNLSRGPGTAVSLLIMLAESVDASSERQCAGKALSSNMRGVCAGRMHPGPARAVLPKAGDLRKKLLETCGGHLSIAGTPTSGRRGRCFMRRRRIWCFRDSFAIVRNDFLTLKFY